MSALTLPLIAVLWGMSSGQGTAMKVGSTPSPQIGAVTSLTSFDACRVLSSEHVAGGSAGGLVLFDAQGQMLQHLTRADGLMGTRVSSIVRGPQGDVWIGGEEGATRLRFETGRLTVVGSIRGAMVRDLAFGNGKVYAASFTQGPLVARMDGRRFAALAEAEGLARRATSIALVGERIYWGTAGSGLWRKQGTDEAVRDVRVAADELVWALESQSEGLWVASESGIRGPSVRVGAARSVRGIEVTSDGVMAASFGGGLIDTSNSSRALADRFLRSVDAGQGLRCAGSESDLWIDRGEGFFRAHAESLAPDNDITAIAESKEASYIATFNHGVARWNGKRFAPIGVDHDPHVNALAIDEEGALWIGGSHELVQINGTKVQRYGRNVGLPSDHVLSLRALDGGGVVVGTSMGAAVIRGGVVSAVGGKRPWELGNVWAVSEDAAGTLWLGGTRGLWRVSASGNVERYTLASGHLPEDWVMALAPFEGGIYVGTYKSGVLRLDVSKDGVTPTTLGEGWVNPSGLHFDSKSQILRAATMHGAFEAKADRKSWDKRIIGLGKDTTVFRPGTGGLWLATRRGLELRGR